MFQSKVVEKIKTRLVCSVTFFLFFEDRTVLDNVEKYCTAGQATYGARALHAGYLRLQTHTENM
jgi:hypothetical protein